MPVTIDQKFHDVIENAEARAIASQGADGVNVVPLSMARVKDDKVWLFNFFMSKTVRNIKDYPEVALACWQGLSGIQVKGVVEYHTEGEVFEEAVAWVREQNPDRVLKGLLILTPEGIFNISAGAEAGQQIA